MKHGNTLVIALALSMMAFAANAQVSVYGAWVRGTVPGQASTGVFMTLKSVQDARLVEARSNVAKVVEIHEMAMQGDVMRMRQIPGLALPAGKPVELRPGGYHVMLIDLHDQLKEGAVVPLSLIVEKPSGERETLNVQVPVRALTTSTSPHKGHGK